MKRGVRAAAWAVACLWLSPAVARAGMPYFPLTEPPWFARQGAGYTGLSRLAGERLEAVSFFLAGVLFCAWVVGRIWNGLRADFPALPRLSFGRSLGLVVLWGFLFVLVLTMISGARELMTPGAWKRTGATYRLAGEPAPAPPKPSPDEVRRREGLERLRKVVAAWQETHDGGIPRRGDLPDEVLNVPGSPGRRYVYGFGSFVACEPEGDGLFRFVLMYGDEIRLMPEAWVREQIGEGKP